MLSNQEALDFINLQKLVKIFFFKEMKYIESECVKLRKY